MKKFLFMCLMSAVCLSQTFAENEVKNVPAQVTETRAGAFSGGTGSEQDPYLISKPEDLVELSNNVNSSAGMFFKMTNDIDMSSVKDFAPIGNNLNGADPTMFMGVFDGCGYTIRNLVMDYEGMGIYNQGIALFGIVMQATIKNIRIEDSSFIGYGMVAPVVAVSFGSTIQNCHTGKNVTATAEKLGAAGIIAFTMMSKSVIEDCSSETTVVAHFVQGGVASGIIACVSEGADGTLIRRCVNYGDVTSDADCAAGILPLVEYPAVVEDCVNFGTIVSNVGGTGIAYYATKPDKDYLIVRNSYNVGEIIGQEIEKVDAVCLGNVFQGGGEESCKVENCFYASDTNGATSRTATAMLSADMKSQDFVDKLNNGRADASWCIKEGVANGFPLPYESSVTSGIENVAVASSVSVSYNAGIVTVSGAKVGDRFTVVDMSGRTVMMTEAQNSELTINLSNVPAGVYIIGNGSVSKKIVK